MLTQSQKDKTLQYIEQVDQHIVDKTPGDEVMEDRGRLAMANNLPLGKQGIQSRTDLAGQIVQVELALAALHYFEHLAKSAVGQVQRHDHGHDKQNLFNQ